MEIERKFLVASIPCLDGFQYAEIEQCYLLDDGVREQRIRKKDQEHYFTEKGKGMLVREENEYAISENEYLELRQKRIGNIIWKRRYFIPVGDVVAELDVYGGCLDGLITVEVEFISEKQAYDFNPPNWFGADITDNSCYKNRNLSKMDAPPIQQ